MVMQRSHSARRGFSLIELLAVMAILGVLASIAFPLTELASRRAKEEELRRSLRQIRTALDEYKRLVDTGRIPRDPLSSGYPPSLGILVEGVEDAQSPQRGKIYLLRRIPRDPFAPDAGPPAESWGLRSYLSSASDPQPGADVYDVFSKSTGLGLDGTPYREW